MSFLNDDLNDSALFCKSITQKRKASSSCNPKSSKQLRLNFPTKASQDKEGRSDGSSQEDGGKGNCYASSYFKSKRTLKNCPLCLKSFKTDSTFSNHMKQCAKAHKMTTQQLLAALELQKKQMQERKDLGLCLESVPTDKKTCSKRKQDKDSDSYDLALGLAISKSLSTAESKGVTIPETQSTLNQFGITTNPPAGPGKKRNENKKSILKERTAEERQRIIIEKVAVVLLDEENEREPERSMSGSSSECRNDQLLDLMKTGEQLWDLGENDERKRIWYVEGMKSLVVPEPVVPEPVVPEPVVPEPVVPPEREQGEVVPEENLEGEVAKLNLPREEVHNDWRKMINNRKLSDVSGRTKDRRSFYLHSVVLCARRPEILDRPLESILEKYNLSTVMAFAEYLYCGTLNGLVRGELKDLSDLAEEFNYSELISVLSCLKTSLSKRCEVSGTGKEVKEVKEKERNKEAAFFQDMEPEFFEGEKEEPKEEEFLEEEKEEKRKEEAGFFQEKDEERKEEKSFEKEEEERKEEKSFEKEEEEREEVEFLEEKEKKEAGFSEEKEGEKKEERKEAEFFEEGEKEEEEEEEEVEFIEEKQKEENEVEFFEEQKGRKEVKFLEKKKEEGKETRFLKQEKEEEEKESKEAGFFEEKEGKEEEDEEVEFIEEKKQESKETGFFDEKEKEKEKEKEEDEEEEEDEDEDEEVEFIKEEWKETGFFEGKKEVRREAELFKQEKEEKKKEEEKEESEDEDEDEVEFIKEEWKDTGFFEGKKEERREAELFKQEKEEKKKEEEKEESEDEDEDEEVEFIKEEWKETGFFEGKKEERRGAEFLKQEKEEKEKKEEEEEEDEDEDEDEEVEFIKEEWKETEFFEGKKEERREAEFFKQNKDEKKKKKEEEEKKEPEFFEEKDLFVDLTQSSDDESVEEEKEEGESENESNADKSFWSFLQQEREREKLELEDREKSTVPIMEEEEEEEEKEMCMDGIQMVGSPRRSEESIECNDVEMKKVECLQRMESDDSATRDIDDAFKMRIESRNSDCIVLSSGSESCESKDLEKAQERLKTPSPGPVNYEIPYYDPYDNFIWFSEEPFSPVKAESQSLITGDVSTDSLKPGEAVSKTPKESDGAEEKKSAGYCSTPVTMRRSLKMKSGRKDGSEPRRTRRSSLSGSRILRKSLDLQFKVRRKKSTPARKSVKRKDLAEVLTDSILNELTKSPALQTSTPVRGRDFVEVTPVANGDEFGESVTPSPNYSKMEEALLKEQLAKYGLKKNLGKNKARKILQHIYEELHPLYNTRTGKIVKVQSSETPKVKKKSKAKSRNTSAKARQNGKNRGGEEKEKEKNLSSEGSSDTLEGPNKDETDGSGPESFSETLTQTAASNPVDLPSAFVEFLENNADYHRKILMYEPIWLEELQKKLKESFKKHFKIADLMDYLDQKCITFRSEAQVKNTQRKNEKRKKIADKAKALPDT